MPEDRRAQTTVNRDARETSTGQETSRSRRAVLAGLGAAAASLAGCTGSGNPTSGSGSDRPSLRWAYDGAPPHFQAVVMDRESLIDEVPADVTPKEASCKSIVQLLVSGKADVAMIGIIPALVAIDKGPDAHIVSSSSADAFVIMARAEVATAFEESGGEAITAFAESKGRPFKLGTYPKGSVSDITARYWRSETIGVPKEAVELVHLGGPGAARQALLADEVDGAVIPEPTPTLIEARDAPYRRISWVGQFIPGEPAGVTVVRDEYARENPDVIEQFIARHREATQFIRDNTGQAAAYMSDAYGGSNALDQETARAALRSRATRYVTDPSGIRTGAEVLAEYAATLGKTDSAQDPDEIIDPTYYEAATEEI